MACAAWEICRGRRPDDDVSLLILNLLYIVYILLRFDLRGRVAADVMVCYCARTSGRTWAAARVDPDSPVQLHFGPRVDPKISMDQLHIQ